MKNDNRGYIDISGLRFGKRVVCWPVGRVSTGIHSSRILWLCMCDCGKLSIIPTGSLRSGKCQSCKKCSHKPPAVYKRFNPGYKMLSAAKCRAKAQNIPFSIDVTDIVIPSVCPLLGIPLVSGIRKGRTSSPNRPTLDKKVPSLGYVKGNVWVISGRANLIKNDATIDEFELILRNWKANL